MKASGCSNVPPPSTPRKNTVTHKRRGWMGTRTRLNILEKRNFSLHQNMNSYILEVTIFGKAVFLKLLKFRRNGYGKVSSKVLTLHFGSISNKAGPNSHYCWKHTLLFLNWIHKQRANIKQSLLSMILIGIFFANVVSIIFTDRSVWTNQIFDSFGTANSFNAFGKYVLLAFWDSFLNLKITGSEETRSKLNISSFVYDRDIFPERLFLKYFKSLFLDSWVSSDNCPVDKIATEAISAPWTSISWTLAGM